MPVKPAARAVHAGSTDTSKHIFGTGGHEGEWLGGAQEAKAGAICKAGSSQ